MDLRELLNRQEEHITVKGAKRVPLGVLSINTPAPKRPKPSVPTESQLEQGDTAIRKGLPALPETSTPQRPTQTSLGPHSLPPISHLTSAITEPNHFLPNSTTRTLSPNTPKTPTRATTQVSTHPNHTFLYGVQNSRKKSEMFFNITSADDFQRRAFYQPRMPSMSEIDSSFDHSATSSSFLQDASVVANTSMDSSNLMGRRSRRKVLWTHEASVLAAREFMTLYESKKSSSFLKKEYQGIAKKLNAKFGDGLFSETSVRNRKGFFQCLSHIYTSLKDHRLYSKKFNDKHVPLLTEEEWKDVSQFFEPSYLRKLKGKVDNEDLEVVCVIFKKRPMKKNDSGHELDEDDSLRQDGKFKEEELKVIKKIVELVQKGLLTLEEVTAIFAQSEEVAWIDLLYPLVNSSTSADSNFLKVVKDNFDLKNVGAGKGEVDLQRFWRMMNMTQNHG